MNILNIIFHSVFHVYTKFKYFYFMLFPVVILVGLFSILWGASMLYEAILFSKETTGVRSLWNEGFILILFGLIMNIPLIIKFKVSSVSDLFLKFYHMSTTFTEKENRFYFGVKAIYRGEEIWKNILMALFCLMMSAGMLWAGLTGLEGFPGTYYYLSGIFFLSMIYYLDNKNVLKSSLIPLLIVICCPIYLFLLFFYFFFIVGFPK